MTPTTQQRRSPLGLFPGQSSPRLYDRIIEVYLSVTTADALAAYKGSIVNSFVKRFCSGYRVGGKASDSV